MADLRQPAPELRPDLVNTGAPLLRGADTRSLGIFGRMLQDGAQNQRDKIDAENTLAIDSFVASLSDMSNIRVTPETALADETNTANPNEIEDTIPELDISHPNNAEALEELSRYEKMRNILEGQGSRLRGEQVRILTLYNDFVRRNPHLANEAGQALKLHSGEGGILARQEQLIRQQELTEQEAARTYVDSINAYIKEYDLPTGINPADAASLIDEKLELDRRVHTAEKERDLLKAEGQLTEEREAKDYQAEGLYLIGKGQELLIDMREEVEMENGVLNMRDPQAFFQRWSLRFDELAAETASRYTGKTMQNVMTDFPLFAQYKEFTQQALSDEFNLKAVNNAVAIQESLLLHDVYRRNPELVAVNVWADMVKGLPESAFDAVFKLHMSSTVAPLADDLTKALLGKSITLEDLNRDDPAVAAEQVRSLVDIIPTLTIGPEATPQERIMLDGINGVINAIGLDETIPVQVFAEFSRLTSEPDVAEKIQSNPETREAFNRALGNYYNRMSTAIAEDINRVMTQDGSGSGLGRPGHEVLDIKFTDRGDIEFSLKEGWNDGGVRGQFESQWLPDYVETMNRRYGTKFGHIARSRAHILNQDQNYRRAANEMFIDGVYNGGQGALDNESDRAFQALRRQPEFADMPEEELRGYIDTFLSSAF